MTVSPAALPATRRLMFLDALRGVAALAVFVRHAANPVLAALGRGPLPFDFGQFGVLVFFLISGFVIPISLERAGLRAFWIKRVFRLYPLYWFSIAVVIVVVGAGVAHESALSLRAMPTSMVLLNLTMVQSLVLPDGPSLRGVYWTLALEMLFYLVATTLLLLRRLAHSVTIAIVAIGLAFAVEATAPWPGYEAAHPLMYLAVMLTGTVLYRTTTGAVSRRAAAAVCALCIALLALVPANGDFLAARLASLPFFALMLGLRWAPRPLVYLGQISYSFYLLHQFSIELIHTPYLALDVMLWFGVTMLFAHATYHLIERPAIQAGRWACAVDGKTGRRKDTKIGI